MLSFIVISSNFKFSLPCAFVFDMKIIKYVLVLLTSLAVSAQEHPPVMSYTPDSYGAQNQNWSISQTSDQTMYFANNSGLLEFDGMNWNLYPVPNNSIVRSVKAIDNLIYTGSYMDFGVWKRNKKMKINKTKKQLKDLLSEVENVSITIANEMFPEFKGKLKDFVPLTKEQRNKVYKAYSDKNNKPMMNEQFTQMQKQLKPMKKPLNEEFKRMQKLAGLNENQMNTNMRLFDLKDKNNESTELFRIENFTNVKEVIDVLNNFGGIVKPYQFTQHGLTSWTVQ